MTIELTKGMLGDSIETIGKVASFKAANSLIQSWKDANKDKYRVEPYFRVIFYDADRAAAIDFGDYAYFIAVKCDSHNEWVAFCNLFGKWNVQ